MKNFISIGLTLLGLITAYGQDSEKARALLDEVYTKVSGYDNIRVDFKYALQNFEANINQETRGDVTLEGDKYLFNYLGSQQLYDGNKVYTIVPENEEVTIEDQTEENNTITPSKMLTFYMKGHT